MESVLDFNQVTEKIIGCAEELSVGTINQL
jgi:hypothetical protein